MDKRQEKLEKELKKILKESDDYAAVIRDTQRHHASLQSKIKSLKHQLEAFKDHVPDNIQISDHAVLRYMERHHFIDVEAVRDEISEKLKGSQTLGSFKHKGFVVRGHTVVTYVGTSEDTANKPLHLEE